jgi:hypothetical protein
MGEYHWLLLVGILTIAAMMAVLSYGYRAVEDGRQSAVGETQPTREPWGVAKIAVYEKGKKIALDSRSNHLREPQITSEEPIISSFLEQIPLDKSQDKDISPEAVREVGSRWFGVATNGVIRTRGPSCDGSHLNESIQSISISTKAGHANHFGLSLHHAHEC